jgi:hypothetical protein
MTFYKITNRRENHFGYQYHDGLNIYEEPLDPYRSNGFHFTDLGNIHRYYGYGVWLREVELPEENIHPNMLQEKNLSTTCEKKIPSKSPPHDKKESLKPRLLSKILYFFKEGKSPKNNSDLQIDKEDKKEPELQIIKGENEWRTNKIILKRKYCLFDLGTYLRFGLDIHQNPYLIDIASANGNMTFLEMIKNMGIHLKYTSMAVTMAACNGHLSVLKWWKNNDEDIIFEPCILDIVSKNGHVKILEWWKNSGLQIIYSENSLLFASQEGHLDVLNWWKESGLELKFPCENDLNSDKKYYQKKILDWWRENYDKRRKKICFDSNQSKKIFQDYRARIPRNSTLS